MDNLPTSQILLSLNIMLFVFIIWKSIYRKSYTTTIYSIALVIAVYYYSIGLYDISCSILTVTNAICTIRASLQKENDKILKE